MISHHGTADEWAKHMAGLAADALADAAIIPAAQVKAATDVIAEEIFVRFAMNDFPPAQA